MIYSAGLFNIQVDGLEGQAGSTGANPLNVILSVVPSNVAATFSSNTSVLAIVFLAVTLGLCMNALGEERTSVLKKLITEINDIVVVFLNYVVTKFGPIAIFVLLSRTFCHLWHPPSEAGHDVCGGNDHPFAGLPVCGLSAVCGSQHQVKSV